MWELSHKKVWAPTNWCFWRVVLEKTLESPLDNKIKPVNPKENQPWIFIGRTLAKAEAPILWPPDVKSWLTGKDPDAGKDWTQKEKGWQRMSWIGSITDSMDMNLSKLWETVENRGAWHATVHGVAKRQTQLSNWTTARRFLSNRYWWLGADSSSGGQEKQQSYWIWRRIGYGCRVKERETRTTTLVGVCTWANRVGIYSDGRCS